MGMQLDGKGQSPYWEKVRDARYRRLVRLASTPVGAVYIRSNETEKQARKRILEAELKRLHVSATQFKRLLDVGRNRHSSELKGKPPGEPAIRRSARDIKPIF